MQFGGINKKILERIEQIDTNYTSYHEKKLLSTNEISS